MEAPGAQKYTLAEIMSMDPDWIQIFTDRLRLPTGSSREVIARRLEQMGLIIHPTIAAPIKPVPISPEITTAERGPFPFAELPPELQVEVLGRTSPTVREGTLVSQGMKELADAALMKNIRENKLVDPTIGIPNRNEYFKVTVRGEGEYFSSEPGLWRNFKKYRTEDIISQRYLMSPTENVVQFHPALIYGVYSKPGETDTHKFVSLAAFIHSSYHKPLKFMTIRSEDDPKLFKIDYGSRAHYQMGIFITLWYTRDETTLEDRMKIIDELGAGTLTLDIRKAKILLTVKETGASRRQRIIYNAKIRIIPLNKIELDGAEMILPSLRDDVAVI